VRATLFSGEQPAYTTMPTLNVGLFYLSVGTQRLLAAVCLYVSPENQRMTPATRLYTVLPLLASKLVDRNMYAFVLVAG